MAESAKTANQLVQEDKEGRENSECGPSMQANTSFLSELNLLIVVLSLFSLSNDDGLHVVEREEEGIKNQQAKACISRLHNNRREINEVKLAGPRSPRFQTTIQDFRHCRRM